jgi:hypothetical protein
MTAIAKHWRPSNPYTIILMDTRPWVIDDMKAIRSTWHLLDFRFINIADEWTSVPTIPESEFEDAAKPTGMFNYKRMCHFFFKGFTDVSVLMEYKYLMRLDDDTCFQDNINYDVFQFLDHKKAAYGYAHTLIDYPFVTKGMGEFVRKYVADNNITYANEELYNATLKKGMGFPYYPPAYNTNFEVINTVRYREESVMKFLTAVSESNMIFHRRWGDAPLRFALGLLFWSEDDVVRLERFGMQHSVWAPFNMSESTGSSLPKGMPPYRFP